MKFIFALLVVSCILCPSCYRQKHRYHLSPHETAFNATISTCAAKLSKKYTLNCSCVSGSMPGGPIRSFGLDFQIQGPLSHNELRSLLIHMASDLLTLINTDENVRPFLKKYPFTVQDISIGLFVIDNKARSIVTPHISFASLDEGKIHYITLSADPIPKIVAEFQETYQEAYKKTQKEDKK
jgi:hypothetical protein